eukprot:3323831-Pyramimonas_sp.AAC.1
MRGWGVADRAASGRRANHRARSVQDGSEAQAADPRAGCRHVLPYVRRHHGQLRRSCPRVSMQR